MARFYGAIGFMETVETRKGVYVEKITERNYFGEVTRDTYKFQTANEQKNDNLNISNDFSIVSDKYAMSNIPGIRYVTYMGAKWKVNNVEVKFPRLILHVSDIYNGEEVEDTDG